MSWTNEMSDKAIYEVMDRCGMLQNMTLRCELDKLVNAVSQAFKPTWGGPDDPDVLKRKIEELQQRLNAADQLISEQRVALTRVYERTHAFAENECSMQVVSVEVIRDIAAKAIGKDNSPPAGGQMSKQVEHLL